jgi:glucokinase
LGDKHLKLSIGVDLGGTNIKFGLVTSDGRILKRLNIPTLANQGPKAVIARIIAAINCLNRYHGVPQALGIGSAGLVNHTKGIIHFSPNLPGWKDIPLKKLIEDEVKVKVFVGNDANAFALGEYCFGAGKGCSSLFGITLGTGIGGGIIVNGKLWLGINQAAGEVGHTSINAFGPKCRCGNYGCLERYAGAEYIVERTIKQLKSQSSKRKPQNSKILKLAKYNYRDITPHIISLAAKKGDPLAKTIIIETGNYVGVGLANVVSLIDPEIIVIGGGVSGFGKLLLDSIKKTVAERIMNFSDRKLKIVLSKLKDDAALLGASQFESALGGLPRE